MSEPSTSDRGTTIFIAVVASVLASVATTYGLHALEGPDEPVEPETVEVPAVIGLDRATAAELVQSRGLRLVVAAEEPSAEQPEGSVTQQDPLAQSVVESGGAVEVTLSQGAPMVTVPTLVGLTVDAARSALEGAGLVVGSQTEGGEGAGGTITASSVEAGTEVDVGATVDLTVAPEGIVIPELLGQSARAARTQLEALGLTVRTRRRYNEGRSEFAVLEVAPPAGTRVEPGSEVTITIND